MTTGSIADIFTALGTLAMAFMAGSAIRAWRKEFIGKKKIELAAEIMEAVFEVQDLIIFARNAFSTQSELEEVKEWLLAEQVKHPDKVDIYENRIQYMVANYRLTKSADKIDKLMALSNKGFMYWGIEFMKKIQELQADIVEIRRASKWMYYNEMKSQQEQSFDTLYADSKGTDEFSLKLSKTIEEIQINLEPLYKDQQKKWKKLQKKS